jgi:hypothetical protein
MADNSPLTAAGDPQRLTVHPHPLLIHPHWRLRICNG